MHLNFSGSEFSADRLCRKKEPSQYTSLHIYDLWTPSHWHNIAALSAIASHSTSQHHSDRGTDR